MDNPHRILLGVDIEITYDRCRTLCVILVGIQILSSFIEFTHHHFISLWIKRPVVFEEQGKWAVIAGALTGLGRAFAKEFALRGMDIVLIDRNEIELKKIAAAIKEKYDVKILVIPTSFEPVVKTYWNIHKQILNLDIGVLVLNLHELQTRPALLAKQHEDVDMEAEIERLIIGNCATTTYLLNLCLPGMYYRSRGVIILVSSFLISLPSPMLSITSACKAYCSFLLRSVRWEVGTHVSLRVLMPGPLQCRWLCLRAPSLFGPTPERYLRSALPLVARHEQTTGYWMHDLVARLVGVIGRVSGDVVEEGVLQCMETIREASMRGHPE